MADLDVARLRTAAQRATGGPWDTAPDYFDSEEAAATDWAYVAIVSPDVMLALLARLAPTSPPATAAAPAE